MPFLPRISAAAMAGAVVLALAPPAAAATGDGTAPVIDHSQNTVVGPTEAAPGRDLAFSAASSGPSFTFNGRGSYHSIGMSQYGAFEQADRGRSSSQIVRSYYSGTDVVKRPIGFDLRVAIVRDAPRVQVVPRGGTASVRYADVPTPTTAAQDSVWTVTIGTDGRCTTTVTGGTTHVGGCPVFDPTARVEIFEPSGSGFESAANAREYGRQAVVEVIADRVGSAWRVDTVVDIPLEEYLYGLAEVPYSWPAASLQAQAIAGRSYALHRMIDRGPNPDAGCSCHVWDSMQDQVYAGHDREVSAQWAQWRAAVDVTATKVVVAPQSAAGYSDTEQGVVQAFYSASSHGRTENKHEVFFPTEWDYMRTVEDDWSLEADKNPYADWSVTIPASTVAARVGLARVDSITVTERRESASAKTVVFRGSGTKTYTADQVRGMFGLLSNGFGIGDEVWGDPPMPSDLFPDDDGSPHEANIDWLANRGITRGCNPPKNTLFCPDAIVTRGQMAAFLVRALNLPPGSGGFQDTNGNTFEADIAALARAGITRGCNPPANTRYCPGDPVTRDQMASFLQRALGLPNGARGVFRDVPSGSTHERAIGALQQARVTLGCNPPTNDRYCPNNGVTRAQMASFLRRGLG